MPDDELAQRVEAIKSLLGLFKLERMVYLSVTLLSLAILVASALRILMQDEPDQAALVFIVSGSGGILYATGRLLRMWSDALRMLGSASPGGNDGDS